MTGRRPNKASRLAPVLILVAVAAFMLGAWWLFPIVHTALSRQDCIASGRVTGC